MRLLHTLRRCANVVGNVALLIVLLIGLALEILWRVATRQRPNPPC